MMTLPLLRLGINIDHVATLRNARDARSAAAPDIVRAAMAAEAGGAHSITIHLREDRRHILDDDVKRLKKWGKLPLNLEMAATEDMLAIALKTRPFAVCIVPEKRREVTTEGGLNAVKQASKLLPLITRLKKAKIRVSLFIDAELPQITAAYALGADAIEIHTGRYCHAKGRAQQKMARTIADAAQFAHSLGLEVHAGHGLNYDNVGAIAAIPEITELNIGHFLVGEALFIGLEASVRRMAEQMDLARTEA